MTVVKTTVDANKARGTEVAFAAAVVEMMHTFIAICFGFAISSFLETNTAVKLAIAVAFIGLAIFIYARQANPGLVEDVDVSQSFLKRGFVVATLNPQAVPFWIFSPGCHKPDFRLHLPGHTVSWFPAWCLHWQVCSTLQFRHRQHLSEIPLQRERPPGKPCAGRYPAIHRPVPGLERFILSWRLSSFGCVLLWQGIQVFPGRIWITTINPADKMSLREKAAAQGGEFGQAGTAKDRPGPHSLNGLLSHLAGIRSGGLDTARQWPRYRYLHVYSTWPCGWASALTSLCANAPPVASNSM